MPVATAAARTITWSGQVWDVRPSGSGSPGPNHWSDADSIVHVDGSELVLSIAKDATGAWSTGEIEGRQHLGYGTYRWVVDSDLSTLDAYDVLGMFTYGGSDPSNNEIDIEPSHWGNLAWDNGSATVWQDPVANVRQSRTFNYSARPPYINQFTWEPGRIHFQIVDATGTRLLDWTVQSGVPVPSTEVPITNYWRDKGLAPGAPGSLRIASFQWFPPGADPALPPAPVETPAGSGIGGGTGATAVRPQASIHVRMAHKRLVRGAASAAIRWHATGAATVRLAVRRMAAHGRYAEVMRVRRSLQAGSGTLDLATRRLRPGRYRLDLSSDTPGVTFTPARLSFAIGR